MVDPWINPFFPGPGQPRYQNYWSGPMNRPTFMMPPGGLDTATAAPPPPPPPPTLFDATNWAPRAQEWVSGGGADSGGSQGGATRDQSISSTPSNPSNFNSNYGLVGSTLGLAAPYGTGALLGMGGTMLDQARYNAMLDAAGVPRSGSHMGSAIAYGLSSLPFGLGSLFGTSPRQAFENDRRAALANGIGINGDYGQAGRGFGIDQANAPVDPVTRESGPMASYPAGFLDWSGGLGNQDAPGGQQSVDPTGPGGFGSPGPGMDQGGFGPGAGAGPGDGGAFGPGFARGGEVPAPSPSQVNSKGFYTPDAMINRINTEYVPGVDYQADEDWTRFREGQQFPPAINRRMIERDINRRGYAGGGNVTPQAMGLLGKIDPPGPDDQVAGLQTGEDVINRRAVAAIKRIPGLLEAINKGDIKRVKGLLG